MSEDLVVDCPPELEVPVPTRQSSRSWSVPDYLARGRAFSGLVG